MNHKQLKYFLALADTLHFGRASNLCFISAPTLSRQIKQLEEEVGVPLFIRDNRSVSLTSQGKAFVAYANATLNQWRLFKGQCQTEQQVLSGEADLYCSVTASYSYIYELFAAFRKQYPDVELNLNTGDPALSISHVQAEKVDLAVAVKPKELPTGLAYTKLGEAKLQMVAPIMECPLSEQINQMNKETLSWSDLAYIVPEQGVLKERLDEFCTLKKFKPRVYAHVSGHEAIVALVSLGFGIALVPDVVLSQSPFKQQVRVLPIDNDKTSIEIGLIAKSSRLKDPVNLAIWQTAQKIFNKSIENN
ncbi:HTH-type transcriptional activator IlvY [Pseudoalteromonas phenolica]|uniref:HTH-type transcriptional activator IlvY n=1 Tax=Pseudoalteromonas phenolica TaxID=161398 RepID=UPI00110AA537|nr:HTH-type transcriptional activator IlvY [Pseudoalteromonas phenolica]TMO57056.1 HTH-type transcriptional activator IlvY [Pseudoalteromonas phenolica]